MAYKPTARREQRAEGRREYDKRRGNAGDRGYTWAWQKAAKAFLSENPLCAECLRQDRVKPADCVDHIIPHRGDMQLFWDQGNWQSLCSTPCHAVKTARGE